MLVPASDVDGKENFCSKIVGQCYTRGRLGYWRKRILG